MPAEDRAEAACAPRAVAALQELLRFLLGTSPRDPEAIGRVTPDEIADGAARLGVVGPVWAALARGAGGGACRAAALRDRMRALNLRRLALAVKAHEDAKAVVRALRAAGVAHVPFKGPFLSLDLYGDPDMRLATDVDIVLPGGRADLAAAREALAPLGYRPPAMSALLEDYYARECREITLSAPGRLAVDVHYGAYPDLPDASFASAAARAHEVVDGGIPRRAFCPADSLIILAAHYWGVPRGARLKWLLDLAMLCARADTFERGWLQAVVSSRATLLVAAAVEGVRRDLGVEPPPGARDALTRTLAPAERAACRRVARDGPEGVPFGMVQAVHRLHLPLKARVRAVRRYLWPHPGRIVLEAGRPDWTPGLGRRLGHALARLARGIGAR